MNTKQPDLYKISPCLYTLCRDKKHDYYCTELEKVYYCILNRSRYSKNSSLKNYCSEYTDSKWSHDYYIKNIMKEFEAKKVVEEMEQSFKTINGMK